MSRPCIKIFKKKSSSSLIKSVIEATKRRAFVRSIVKSTIANGEAGLIHIEVLSKILKSVIRVWHQGRVVQEFGRDRTKLPIDVEFNFTPRGGHWTLRGGRNPVGACGVNDCLYSVVGSQAGEDAAQLRRWTANRIRRDLEIIAKRVVGKADVLMSGGARYEGSSPRDAERILDASQTGQGHPDGRPGHPRGHASFSGGGRNEDSIEGYSMSRWRSGFLTRKDQDLVCHYTLRTSRARDLMESLNSGSFKADSHIGRGQIDYDPLPLASIWNGGRMTSEPQDFQKVVLVGKHFMGKQDDVYADIFILTFYPVI